MRACDFQPMRARKSYEPLVILIGRTETLGEFSRCQVPMIVGTGGIIKLLEEIGEFSTMTQRQRDTNAQPLFSMKPSGEISARVRRRRMLNRLPRAPLDRGRERKNPRGYTS